MNEKKFMKRLYKPKEFRRFLFDLMAGRGASKGLPKEDQISKQFMERIMMAVTEVNGCRYCSYFHTRVSLKAGLKREEIRRTLEGDFKDAPQDELAALYFAQYYAESAGNPDTESLRCLVEAYGDRKSQAILTYIRAIMVGNAWGNMFDALRMRIKGSPSAGMTIWDELGVIFGPFLYIPLILVKMIYSHPNSQKQTGKEKIIDELNA